MQINLKQREIEQALKNFISQQGISLVGKSITMAFTAGRKDTGLSVELTIEDKGIPGFSPKEPINPDVTIEMQIPAVTEAETPPEEPKAAPASGVGLFT